MLLQIHSSYAKFFGIFVLLYCGIFYIYMFQVEILEADSAESGNNSVMPRLSVWRRKLAPDKRIKAQPGPPFVRRKLFAFVNRNATTKPPDIVQLPNTTTSAERYWMVIQRDLAKQQPGLGEEGRAVTLAGKARTLGEEVYDKIALNEEVSVRISYNRNLSDARHPLCQEQLYDAVLPSASVITIFYNEPYSVVVRTAHSVLNTCPSPQLKEVILVDDGSSNEELGFKLDYYVKIYLKSRNVKLLRLDRRLGLIRARLAGARLATGDVLIFLDAHCEATVGWCEPLLHRIKHARTHVVMPIIDVIDAQTFEYSSYGYDGFEVGGFQWDGQYTWIEPSGRERARQARECQVPQKICPMQSPTMAGGLFGIDRQYFWELGSYDEEMDGWGGENLELSFRIWQCGGILETMPCSRVGHVFREFHPYSFPDNRDTHGINTARMALVWMDEYANILYINRPDLKSHPLVGNVTSRLQLRQRLQCKNFDWYLQHVYPEKFVPTKNAIAYGRIRTASKNKCLDNLDGSTDSTAYMHIYLCSLMLTKNQFYSYTNDRVLRNEVTCLITKQINATEAGVELVTCEHNIYNCEKWSYENQQLMNEKSGLCMDYEGLRNIAKVRMAPCNNESTTQRWVIEHNENWT